MNITVANGKNEQCIAYTYNNQNVFILYKNLNSLPYRDNVLIIEASQKDINSVLTDNFAYNTPYQNINIDIGTIKKFIWQPGLHDNLQETLEYDEYEKNIAKRDLKILLEKAQDILTYIEPSSQSLQAYGYKLRELLILASTEVENILRFYTPNPTNKNLNTSDYIQIMQKVALNKYKISFIDCVNKFSCKPFENWNNASPTQSIQWYNAYNNVKHDKANNIDQATLENCLNAVAAVVILFCVRYSPYVLYHDTDSCSAVFKNSIEVNIEKTTIDDIYIPILNGEKTYSGATYFSHKFQNGTEIANILNKIVTNPWIIVQ